MKFEQTPEGQKFAHTVLSAMRDGQRDLEAGKVEFVDKKGRNVYRVLLFGLRWRSDGKGLNCYRAFDGSEQYAISKGDDRMWSGVLHCADEKDPKLAAIKEIVDDDGRTTKFKTLHEAKTAAEGMARRRPWTRGGAP